MQAQFNIGITAKRSTGRITLTTDLDGLAGLRDNTTREYSKYFAEALELLQPTVAGEVVDQPPLPGL